MLAFNANIYKIFGFYSLIGKVSNCDLDYTGSSPVKNLFILCNIIGNVLNCKFKEVGSNPSRV